MKIDNKLNLVIPIESEESEIFVHSAPITASTFDRHYLVLARVFAQIMGFGLDIVGGPRIAYNLLRDAAIETKTWEGPAGVEAGLMREIERLTNVVIKKDGRWETITYDEAVKDQIDEEDVSEVRNALVFFTVLSHMVRRKERQKAIASAVNLWGALTSALNCTAFAASLPISTETGSSQKASQVSSPQPSIGPVVKAFPS